MKVKENLVLIDAGEVNLEGNLTIPQSSRGIVVFAHGSGSSRHSPRNRYVAEVLNQVGLATLLFDLLTSQEEVIDLQTRHLRFDINFLAQRLVKVTDWLLKEPEIQDNKIGYFGASTGAAAALVAAAQKPQEVAAVVSRGGRPDLAGEALGEVKAPTLLIVGGNDVPVIGMNEEALAQIKVEKKLEIVPGATHLFAEPGTLESAAKLAQQWFKSHLQS